MFCRTAAFLLALSAAGSAAYADRIQSPLPPAGQTTTYSIKGGGAAAVLMDGEDAGLPVNIDTDAAIQRKIVDVKPDGTLTTEETVTRRDLKVNDQPLKIPTPPRATVVTDPAGKITQVLVDGQPAGAPIGIADLQSVLARWQLPARDYAVGETWSQAVPLAAKGLGKSVDLNFTGTYDGMKSIGGRSLMQFSSHLRAPVTLTPTSNYGMGGFTITSVTLNAVDQKSSYDPVSGLLLDASTSVKMDVGVRMGEDARALSMVVRAPLDLTTHLENNGPAAQALPTPPAAPAPQTGDKTEAPSKTP